MKLKIKVLILNEHGKTVFIPCHVKPHIEIDLDEHLRNCHLQPVNYQTRRFVVRHLLKIFAQMFHCPLGWFVETESAISKETLYYPERGQTAVELQLYAKPPGNPQLN